MTLYVLCGLPASGKTTLSTKLANEHNAKIYHYDEFKKGSKPQESKQTHQRLYSLIAQDLLAGYDVVLDDLHLALEWRQSLLTTIKNIPCKKILIVMTTPLEVCVARNTERNNGLPNSVIYHLNTRYCPPSLDEGWDDIWCF